MLIFIAMTQRYAPIILTSLNVGTSNLSVRSKMNSHELSLYTDV